MKLNRADKTKLLDTAKKVYGVYTALDFFKTRSFTTDSGQKSLHDLCKQAVLDKNYNQDVVIDGVHYKLVLTPGAANSYSVSFSRVVRGAVDSLTKTVSSYSNAEVLGLLTNQQFTVTSSGTDEEISTSIKINDHLSVGGKGKVDLYRTHLVTLYHIIQKIESEEDISSLLIALATGSGKTYVQALWMLVLALSGNNGVFAVPDKLVSQFAKDLKRLLPDEFVDSMSLLRDKKPSPQAEEALKTLRQPQTTGQIIIGSSESLLDKHYHDLLEANSAHTYLAFDEQHLIMKAERRRIRLIELSKQKISMFLTATPNPETYELSGNVPVAIMSSGQKKEAGQGLFPHVASFQAKPVSERNKLKNYRFWTAEFWVNIFNGVLLSLTNAIQKEHSSAAVSLIDDLFYYHFDKEGETDARWRMQVPAARKMLCIIDDNETLVNFCHALQNKDSDRRDVYKDGNLVDRSDVASFFNLPDAEVDVIRADLTAKRAEYDASLKPDEQRIRGSHRIKTFANQIEYTILHNMIEYVLTDVTGLDEIEHNRLRKHNMNELQELVIKNFQPRTAAYYQQKLEKEIDADGARVIGGLLADFSNVLGQFIANKSKNQGELRDFIDNWPLYKDLIDSIKWRIPRFVDRFEKYARSHLMMGVMTGMGKDETPVGESRPFSQLKRHVQHIYDESGSLQDHAKKRKHTSLETLNDTSTESVFTPEYLDISEEIADNYFRLGFVGVYVSNKKTEGFSDRNLHTVINIAEDTLSHTNNPETQIQGIGRNRGLDATIEPAYIHSLGWKQETVFDLSHLESSDYYPEFFKAQKEYNTGYVKVLGAKVGQQIIAWVRAHLDDDETINPDRLKRQVLRFVALALREINNKNSHKLKLSRAQLTTIVDYAMKSLDKEIATINKPYRLSFFLTALSYTINFISECYYTIKRIPAAWKIFSYSWFGSKADTEGYELTLMLITSFDKLDTSTLEEKPYLLKDEQGKYQIWGYKENKWQLTPIAELDIDYEWNEDQTVYISSQNEVFKTLKKGHTHTHPKLSDEQKKAEAVYLKILGASTFKDISSQLSSVFEFKNWLGRKTQGIRAHLSKNISNYLNQKGLQEYTLHQQQLLDPLLIHFVVDSKKKQVADALMAFPQSINFLHAHLPLLTSLLKKTPERSEQFKAGVLSFLHHIPGLSDLKLKDIANYPEQMAATLNLFSESPLKTVVNNPIIQKSVVVRLTLFLQNEFSNSLSAFVTYPNAVLVKKLLGKDQNAQLFAEHLMKQLSNGLELSPELLFAELKSFLKLSELKLLNEESGAIEVELNKIQEKITTNLVKHLDDTMLDQIVTLIEKQLVPLLVNLYPQENRALLFAAAADKTKIKKLILEQGSALNSWGAMDGGELANLIFSHLSEEPLPARINLEQEVDRAKSFITEQFQGIMNKGIVNLFAGKLFAPSSWSLTPQYLYDKAIADLLQSDAFLNAISLLLPYDQWLKLKSDVRKNYPALIQISRVLIDKMSGGETDFPSPEELLGLLNKHLKSDYESTDQAKQKAQNNLEGLIKRITDNPMAHLSSSVKKELIQIGLNRLLPLLASFIKEDYKKQQFLNASRDQNLIYDFMLNNKELLSSLMTHSEDTLQSEALGLINQLVPSQAKLVLTDIHNPLLHAEQTGEKIGKGVQKKMLMAFLSSELFRNALRNSFNQQDYQLIITVFASDKSIEALADALITKSLDTLDKDKVLAVLKTQNPSLGQIQPLDTRLHAFEDFITKMSDALGSHLDKNKVSGMIAESVSPVLFNKKFIKRIDSLIGFLEEQDLVVLFSALGKEAPELEAKNFLRFMSILRKQDKESLALEFLTLPKDSTQLEFDQLAVKKMLDNIHALIEQVLDCHCYYNGQDRKGSEGTSNRPKLLERLSPDLADITIEVDRGSFFSNFSRKGFYIHAITRGLAAGGKVSADANQHIVKALERVKTHILRPLWWGTNVSNLSYNFIKACRDLAHAFVAAWYGLVNGSKSTLNWMTGRTYFKISEKHPDSEDFNETAFDFSSTVNELEPLGAEQVTEKECPVDAVTHLEDFITRRPARPGFFGGTLGKVDDGHEEPSHSPKV